LKRGDFAMIDEEIRAFRESTECRIRDCENLMSNVIKKLRERIAGNPVDDASLISFYAEELVSLRTILVSLRDTIKMLDAIDKAQQLEDKHEHQH
jgi:hypothetical protein